MQDTCSLRGQDCICGQWEKDVDQREMEIEGILMPGLLMFGCAVAAQISRLGGVIRLWVKTNGTILG